MYYTGKEHRYYSLITLMIAQVFDDPPPQFKLYNNNTAEDLRCIINSA